MQVSGSTLYVSGNISAGANMRIDVPLTVLSITSSIIVVSSSVVFQSGSTMWGDSADDLHQFTGSISVKGGISGSLSGSFFGDATVTNLTGSLQRLISGETYLAGDNNVNITTKSNGQVSVRLREPAQIGLILFATSTASYVPALPITSAGGWLINNSGILLVSSSG